MREAARTRPAIPPARPPRAPGRAFLEGALAERSSAALIEGFRAAIAAEGMTRHFCVRHDAQYGLRLLACDYPFDPMIVAELGQLRFEFEGVRGERIGVTMAGGAVSADPGRRARLHGYAMLYAVRLPALIAKKAQ